MTINELKQFCVNENRTCPTPPMWVKFEENLANKTGEQPPHSFILSYWFETSDEDKARRVEEQIDCAEKHGLLDFAIEYFTSLQPKDWHKGSTRK